MKVSFDADLNDMVDVTMRTIGKKNAKYYSDLAVIAAGSGGLFGLIGYLLWSQSWVAAVIGFAFGAIYTVAYNYNLRERRARKFIEERQLIKGPALHVEVDRRCGNFVQAVGRNNYPRMEHDQIDQRN